LCSVVSSVGGMVSMLVMWLISFMMFTFASCVLLGRGCCDVKLDKRLRNVALLCNVMTSLWAVYDQ